MNVPLTLAVLLLLPFLLPIPVSGGGDMMGTGLILDDPPIYDGKLNTTDAPNATDLSDSPYFPEVRSQGQTGSCSAWAITYYAYGYMEARRNNWTGASEGNNDQLLSPSYIYNRVNGGTDSGSSIYRCMQAMRDWGVSTWSEFPFTTDPVPLGSPAAHAEAISHAPRDYHYSYDENGLWATIRSLTANHTPVAFAIDSYEYENAFSDGNYIISAQEYDSTTVNHANCIVGYDDSVSDDGETGAFRVVNSWGDGFGDGGFYWLTYDALNETDSGIYYLSQSNRDYSYIVEWQNFEKPLRTDRFTLNGYELFVIENEDLRYPEYMCAICPPSVEFGFKGSTGRTTAWISYQGLGGQKAENLTSPFTVTLTYDLTNTITHQMEVT